jgi:hypothetical protein
MCLTEKKEKNGKFRKVDMLLLLKKEKQKLT